MFEGEKNMLIAVKILYVQKWNDMAIPTMEGWMEEMMELAEMAKLTALIKGNNYLVLFLLGNRF